MTSVDLARPRILMLPGWAQLASTFRARIRGIVAEIGDKVELVFADPVKTSFSYLAFRKPTSFHD